MDLPNNMQIICPIRGILRVNKRSKDGLSASEEYYRVEAIKYLLSKGYPKENFWIEPVIKRFGNSGRNSFRSDFAVLDIPSSSVTNKDTDALLAHTLLICEVKRDSKKSSYVKETQVKPMLDFSIKQNTLALYWDNLDKRVFWQEVNNGVKEIKEGPISFLPKFGFSIKTNPLTFNTIEPAESLVDIFSRIEDILHKASISLEKRYEIILQLLLAKIFDEHAFETRGDLPLEIQDYRSLGTSKEMTRKKIDDVVKRAIQFYGKHLPNKISDKLPLSDDTLFDILQIIAPIKIIYSRRDVVQTFYMKFAKDLYKWDMAQYFTPTTVTDFIIDIINPQFGEHVADPACGSADFLVATYRFGRNYNPGFADSIWGADNSDNAVQVAVLNMILNGDGKSKIIKEDSLVNVKQHSNQYDIIVCNPPFGTKIVEKRPEVLCLYELGYEWVRDEQGVLKKTDNLLPQQETGVLFAELCVQECTKGGRIALIVPNGYLGNRSMKYRTVREWLLKNTRIAAMVSLPRFTFKSSGADVSASVLFLEKRTSPLSCLADDQPYCFAVEMIEKVGWDAGNKKAAPIYKRNNEDGSLIIGEDGAPVLDCDFADSIERIITSDATVCFEWLNRGREKNISQNSWTIESNLIYADKDLTLDPKRFSRKFLELRRSLTAGRHFVLGDIVDFLPERETVLGEKVLINKSKLYKYVEIQDIGHGDFCTKEMRGWELPSRAKHFAEPDDIYFGAIWGSSGKWCYIPQDTSDVVVTNGCFRCRMKPGKEKYLPDLLAYLNSEGWGVQLRALSRGSDGLAEICEEDVRMVIIPRLEENIRNSLLPYIQNLMIGTDSIYSVVTQLIKNNRLDYHDPDKRPSHIVLV